MTDAILSKAELLTNIQDSWNELTAYLQLLTDAQLALQVDAVGWTVKDHLIHIAIWEEYMCVLLAGHCRWEAMNIDKTLWQTDDFDQINAVVQQRTQATSLADALKMLQDNH